MSNSKISYLTKISNEIDNSKNISLKYRLKIKLDYIDTKIKNHEIKIDNLKKDKILVNSQLQELIQEQNEKLKHDKQVYHCPCGSIILKCKKNKHITSKKHCLFLDKNPNIVIE